ncbi:MAG TPA: ChaN family lipoprotein [Pyrinomonadaceae bacterium]|nr:ChaN family lipoprotein [Pyrinomonadaceae bacterium]
MSSRLTLIVFLLLAATVMAQDNKPKYNIFTSAGEPATMDQIIAAASASDVVFLGEFHDDAVGHAFQFEVFQRAVNDLGTKRPITLSLEMFERDVQIVLDEYLRGQITEDHFLRSSRPWGNYKADYRPLVELAKEKSLPVIAANAPRRYVNMVSRSGREALSALTPEAKLWLAPLPYAEASEAYSNKFKALMGSSMEARMGLDNILSSQSLWDATMAYWISEGLKAKENGLVVHLNGGFHTEQRLGTVEHLAKYRPDAKAIVVTIRYEEAFDTFNREKHTGLGDFVVLTDAAAPRSKR